MTRTALLNKQQIIRCAYDIAQEKGKSAITIREIGNRLGKSTAPIYTQYPSIEDIITDLKKYITDLLHRSTMEKRTNDGFLNMGVGFLAFVMENKLIFNDFFLTKGQTKFDLDNEDCSSIDQMRGNPLTSVLEDEQLRTLLLDMKIYTYGLATMICTGTGPEKELDFYKDSLERTGSSLISYYLYSSGKYETVLNNIIKENSNIEVTKK